MLITHVPSLRSKKLSSCELELPGGQTSWHVLAAWATAAIVIKGVVAHHLEIVGPCGFRPLFENFG
jgi:hypothetical protein